MIVDRAALIKQLFLEASELAGEARHQYLAARCGDDPPLRAAVERLLTADERMQQAFLEGQPCDPPPTPVPRRIGPFRILRTLGEGGMGAVFEAEQDHPRRRVALKMVRPAVISPALLRRFECEVQILGQLRHRGIAQVYEAGTDDDGTGPVPYFAMEFIEGRPLMDFVRAQRLSVRQRLELMAEVCDAVHHAHQNGVIHRDLKPANILVERTSEGTHQPRILDFGVARAIRSDEYLMTMHTEAGQLMGTLPYMSPEQVAGRADELDVRSDVYSLGVILYEMLAGRLPYELRGLPLPEAGSIICEQEPTRLSSVDTALRGDVENIVGKALAKEKERRYQSAAGLRDDLRRFLADEPIIARPTSQLYQLLKFAKRNKGLAGGVGVAFAVLLVAVIGISFALVRATRAEHAALLSAAKSTSVSKFLQNMLAGVNPEEVGPRALTVREVLDHAAARVEQELADQPEVAAAVHQTLGNHYRTLGFYLDADRHLRRAVELRRTLAPGDDAELADALHDLAANLQEKLDIADAEAPTREALEIRRRLFGSDSLEVAESLYELAAILAEQQRAQEAEPLIRESLDIRRRRLGDTHAAVATSAGMLGWCLMALGRMDEAESALRNALDMVRRLPGDNERMLAGRLTFLANLLRVQGKEWEEEAVLREAIEIRTRRLGADHPSLAWNLLCLSHVRRRAGDLEEAENACRKALEIYLKRRAPVHRDIADCQQAMAQIYDARGLLGEAESWWAACLEMRRKLLPPEHPDLNYAEDSLARNREAQRGAYSAPNAIGAR